MCINPLYASTLGVPDSDTALLIKLLGTEIQATAGILEILNVSSKTLESIEKIHSKIEDKHTKAIQLEYYANTIANTPKTLKKVKSLSTLHQNLYSLNSLKKEGASLMALDKTNKSSSEILKNKISTNSNDKKLAFHYLQKSGSANSQISSSIYGAKASALGSYKLTSINESLDLMNYQMLAQNNYLVEKHKLEQYSQKIRNQRWGIVKEEEKKK